MEIGRVVCSVSGHDKGLYMVVVGNTADGVLVCDGKERPLQNPKLKNVKYKEETLCQKKI